jgi:NADH-quinone oxidoreductase subunit E
VNQLKQKYPAEVQAILAKYPPDQKRAAVMPLIYLAQREQNFVTRRSLEDIAELTGISTTDIASVIGFYTLFHNDQEAGGRYRIQVCNDLPCALRGADEFLQKLCENVGVQVGETTSDGKITIEAVTCLAGCDHAPLFQVQGDGDISYHENQTVESALQVIAELRQRPEPVFPAQEVQK